MEWTLHFFAAYLYWSNQWPSFQELRSFWKWEDLPHCWWVLGPPLWRFKGPLTMFCECLWKRDLSPSPEFFPCLSSPRRPREGSHLPHLLIPMLMRVPVQSQGAGVLVRMLGSSESVYIGKRITGKWVIVTQWNTSQGRHFKQLDRLVPLTRLLPG